MNGGTYMNKELRYAAPRRTHVQGSSHVESTRVFVRLLLASLHRLILIRLERRVYGW